jgi:putative hemolysin
MYVKELHSIYPVYGKDYDDIVGVVDLKIFSRILMMKISIVADHDGAPFIMEHTAAKSLGKV